MIDIEGAELAALRSFPWNSMSCPKIFCEMHPYAWKDLGYTARDFIQFFQEHAMRCLDVYLEEHVSFSEKDYIGPCLLLQRTG
jgi:hypothetical protein